MDNEHWTFVETFNVVLFTQALGIAFVLIVLVISSYSLVKANSD